MDTCSFGFVYFALALAQTEATLNLLEDSHFNHQASCEDYRYDGRRLLFADLVIGGKVFDRINCGEAVPLDDVTKDIPVVKFSQVRTFAFLVRSMYCDLQCQKIR